VAGKPPLEKVVKRFLPLIEGYACRFKHVYHINTVIDRDDLVSAGVTGLIEAYYRYDPSRKVRFEVFAWPRIKGAMLDEIRKLYPGTRNTGKKKKGLKEKETESARERTGGLKFISFEDLMREVSASEEDEPEIMALYADGDPFEKYALKEVCERVRKALRYLSEKERLVLILHYYEGLGVKEIGEMLGYTGGRIHQIRRAAILKLRESREFAEER